MQYLLDTVALVRHFTGQGRMGKKASGILNSIESSGDTLFISVISLAEVMYLAEKNRIEVGLSETLNLIDSSSKYFVIDLNSDILRVAQTVEFAELHDRLILATAKWLGIKIISSDGEFTRVKGVDVVWG